jgi:DNA-binding MarR family transcriptional regulator
MSIKALAWAWDYQTKDPLEKLVLLCVADHMNDSMGQAWPSVQRICELCGCSRATVKRKLKQLEDAGVIHRQKRFNKTDMTRVGLTVRRLTLSPQTVLLRAHTEPLTLIIL